MLTSEDALPLGDRGEHGLDRGNDSDWSMLCFGFAACQNKCKAIVVSEHAVRSATPRLLAGRRE